MRALLLARAQSDLAQAVDFYNGREAGLGRDFAIEFCRTLGKILQYPGIGARFTRQTRRYQIRRFQHGVLYAVRGETLLVSAVMDLRRGPSAWRERARDL